MKDTKSDKVTFQMVIRSIPTTNAYGVTLGELVDGQLHPTSRWPANAISDWTFVRENPLAPGQRYVEAEHLCELVSSLGLEWDSCMIVSNFLVFTVTDFANEKSSEEEE